MAWSRGVLWPDPNAAGISILAVLGSHGVMSWNTQAGYIRPIVPRSGKDVG